ncbi:MAG: UPF0147 family protein [Candidatus Woesearchaeota archaeon]
MSEEKVESIINVMNELLDDSAVPKNVKLKIENAMNSLKEKTDLNIRVNKALDELDEVGDDNNIEPYTRSQIWNLVSALEML